MAIEKATANHSPVLAVYAARLDLLVNWIGPLFFIFSSLPSNHPLLHSLPFPFFAPLTFFLPQDFLLLITFPLFFFPFIHFIHVSTRWLFTVFLFLFLYLVSLYLTLLLTSFFCNIDMEKQASLFDTSYNVHPLHESHHPLRRPSPSSSESCSLSSTPGPNNQDEAGLCSVFDKLKVDDFGERR